MASRFASSAVRLLPFAPSGVRSIPAYQSARSTVLPPFVSAANLSLRCSNGPLPSPRELPLSPDRSTTAPISRPHSPNSASISPVPAAVLSALIVAGLSSFLPLYARRLFCLRDDQPHQLGRHRPRGMAGNHSLVARQVLFAAISRSRPATPSESRPPSASPAQSSSRSSRRPNRETNPTELRVSQAVPWPPPRMSPVPPPCLGP